MAHIGRPGYSLTQPLARSAESGTETHKVLYYVEEDEDMKSFYCEGGWGEISFRKMFLTETP